MPMAAVTMATLTMAERREMAATFALARDEEDKALLILLREHGVIALVGTASGGDDEGFVTSVCLVDSDGLVATEHSIYSQKMDVLDVNAAYKAADPSFIPRHARPVGELVLGLAGRLFHNYDPTYGSGRNCDDSFIMPVPKEGESFHVRLGSGEINDDAAGFIAIMPSAMVP